MFQIKSYPRVIRLSIGFLIFLLAGLQYKVWFGESGVFKRHIVVVELEKKRNSLEGLRATNLTLRAQISSLKDNVNSYERLARSELGMIKRGELYIYAETRFDTLCRYYARDFRHIMPVLCRNFLKRRAWRAAPLACPDASQQIPLGVHFDFSHNIIVQCEGETNFKVWDIIKDEDQPRTNMSITDIPLLDVDMKSGDAIWIPKYYPHLATSATPRMSVSFPINGDPIYGDNLQERDWVKI